MSVMAPEQIVVDSRARTLRKRRVLLIAYSFPPVGGAGVQRPAKWTKYLPQCGWDVTVLTPENPSVPLRDESLLAEIPPETRILRAKTWEPDYRVKQQLAAASSGAQRTSVSQRLRRAMTAAMKSLAHAVLQPDPQVLWVRHAIRAATAELRRVRHDAILVTVPPYSALFIGAALKQRFGLPLVFDFRDEWDLSSRYLEQASRGGWSRWIQARMQRTLLRQADAVVATTQASAQTYQDKLSEVGNPARSHCIYNGFDPDDFAAEKPFHNGPFSPVGKVADRPNEGVMGQDAGQGADTFRLVYAGTLWNLTDIEPLVLAVERLHAERPELLSRLELVCIGRKTPEQQRILDRVRRTNCRAEFPDYCPHDAVAGWLHSADALCLTLSDVPGAERVVPAKLFEYLATGKPLLSIVPHGETARIVRGLRHEGHFVPRDAAGIANWLTDRLASANDRRVGRVAPERIAPFSRPVLTQRLAEVLDSVAVGSLNNPR